MTVVDEAIGNALRVAVKQLRWSRRCRPADEATPTFSLVLAHIAHIRCRRYLDAREPWQQKLEGLQHRND